MIRTNTSVNLLICAGVRYRFDVIILRQNVIYSTQKIVRVGVLERIARSGEAMEEVERQ